MGPFNPAFQKALVLCPHVDDGELGCGGTIAQIRAAGAEVHYLGLSICETSVPAEFPPDILATEVLTATAELGVPESHVHIHRFPVRHFPQHRQDILELLVATRRELNPDLVLLPCEDDVHQDHRTVFEEGIRAFKQTTVLGYELPWNNLQSRANAFVSLGDAPLQQKINAVAAYASQQHRDYLSAEFIRSLAVVRGRQASVPLAEAFQVLRWRIC